MSEQPEQLQTVEESTSTNESESEVEIEFGSPDTIEDVFGSVPPGSTLLKIALNGNKLPIGYTSFFRLSSIFVTRLASSKYGLAASLSSSRVAGGSRN
jgi:hypothetical protein